MLGDLLKVPQALAKLQGRGHAYDLLITALRDRDNPHKLPTATALQQQCGLKPALLRQWLEALHQDFLVALATELDFLAFPQVEYCLIVPGRGENLLIRCHLPYAPQLGENVSLDAVRAATGHDAYYVDHVHSEYEEGRITVNVLLQPGYYDPYFSHLRTRARFEGKLPTMIEREMGPEELRTYLRHIYASSPAASFTSPSATPSSRSRGWGG